FLGQRWRLLFLRDLLVGPRRYSDIAGGLPGIPSNLLSTRLKELEDDRLIIRRVRSSPDRSVVYTVTERGAALRPALDALSLWGAATMDEPREGEVVTTASLISAQIGRASCRDRGSIAEVVRGWKRTGGW